MTLTSISLEDNKEVMIDSGNLAAIIHWTEDSAKEAFTFIDRARGSKLGNFQKTDWAFNIQTTIDDLAADGRDLVKIPYVSGERHLGDAWINPEAFQCVIVSQPSDNGTVGALLDIEGYGRLETQLKPDVLDSFMARVSAIKPNLMRVNPDLAHARFYKPAYTIFDADQVESIRPNGITSIDVNLRGAAMMGPGRIDFKLATEDENNQNLQQITINRMAKKYRGLLKIADLNEEKVLRELMMRSQSYSDRLGIQMMRDFSAAVAKKATQLVEIKFAKEPNYVDPLRVSWAYTHEKNIQFQFATPAYIQYGNDFGVYFASPEDAEKSYTAFAQQIKKPAP
jgi:hypothetical protein